MTTYIQARDAVATLIRDKFAADQPTVKLVWQGGQAVDQDTVTANMYVRVEIDFDDALQLTMNGMPEHQVLGIVYFRIFHKEGSGMRGVAQMIDYITNTFKFVTATHYRFEQPAPGRKVPFRNGWGEQEVEAPFKFFSI